MKRKVGSLFLILFSVCYLLPSCGSKNTQPEKISPEKVYDVILERIQNDFESKIDIATAAKDIPGYLEKYDAEQGSFSDVDYAAIDRTNWPPLRHIERLYVMAFAYTMPDNPYYQDESILKAIEKGLEFWCNRDPNCNNWWYNQIGEPQLTGKILIQLRKGKQQLAQSVEDMVIARLVKKGGDPKKWTGANKTDIALHWLYRACLTKDKETLDIAVSEGYNPIRFIPFGEGIQPDYSYLQHGPQLYIGGYGDEFLKGVLMFADYTANTDYAISEEQLDMVRNFALEAYFKVIRGRYIHMNVIGRGMSRKDSLMKYPTFAETLKRVDAENFATYDTIAKRMKGELPVSAGVKPSNTTFFIGDYVAHIRPKYAMGVRTVSDRTARNEYGNGENLKTYFLSDGNMHLTQEGDEYFNIFPVWDWSRLPGVTNPYYASDEIPMAASDWQTRGTESFVGGASDSLYSVNVYRLDDKYAGINTSAYKSWFFFDEEIVCLGSDITSTNNRPINTTIDQNLQRSEVTVCTTDSDKAYEIGNGESVFENNLKWVHHNNRGYLFPKGGKIHVKNNVVQEGDWNVINNAQAKGKVEELVFTTWIDHGKKPQKQTYEYIIVPNKSIAEMQSYNADNIDICANGSDVQAVYHKGLNILSIAFTKAGTFKYGDMSITVNQPATMLLKNLGTKEVTMHVSDPTQAKGVLTVSALIPSVSAEAQTIDIDMTNAAEFAGKTHKRVFK